MVKLFANEVEYAVAFYFLLNCKNFVIFCEKLKVFIRKADKYIYKRFFMGINNLQFLNYTVNRKMTTEEFAKTANYVSVSDNVPISLNSKPIENEISVASVGSTLSDEALEKLYMSAKVTTVANPATNGVKLSTSYRSFSPAEIMQIKTVIYNLTDISIVGALKLQSNPQISKML